MQSSGAIALWVRSHVKRDWRAFALIAAAVALAGGFAMTAGIGARRAASAWEDFLDRTRFPDFASEVPATATQDIVQDVQSRPGVEGVVAFGYITVSPEQFGLATPEQPMGAFTGLTPGFGTDFYRPIITDGRAADPTRADEFTINRVMADVTGLQPGDAVVLVSVPSAVRQPATMVGIHVGVLDTGLNTGTPLSLLTPAFGAKWFGVYLAALSPEFREGYSAVVMGNVSSETTRAHLLAEGVRPTMGFAPQIATSLDTLATAYAVLAAVAAIGAAVAISQVVSRRIRRQAGSAPTLAALGFRPSGRRLALAGSDLGAAALGLLIVPLVAYLASPLTGRGLVRQVEPTTGRVGDPVLMALGVCAAAIVTFAIAVGAAWRADTTAPISRAHSRAAPGSLPGPAGMFGARVAAGWASRSDRTVARSHIAGLCVSVAAVVAVVTWSAAARHLVETPARYGATWDAVVSSNDDGSSEFNPSVLDEAQAALDADPRLGRSLGRGITGMVGISFGRVEVLQIDPATGPWWPDLLSGRIPRDPHEITVGSGLLDAGQRLGDQLDIGGVRPFTIVGEHVVTVFSNGEFGETVAMLAGTLPPAFMATPQALMWVELGSGKTIQDLENVTRDFFSVRSAVDAQPGNVSNLGRIGGLDELLLLVCIVLALATLANGLILATKARRRDHAAMRSLGASRSTVAGSVRWHTGIVTAIGGVVGIPLGLIVGAALWRHTASGVYVDGTLRRPLAVAVVIAIGLAVAGALVAWSTGSAAARRSRQRLEVE